MTAAAAGPLPRAAAATGRASVAGGLRVFALVAVAIGIAAALTNYLARGSLWEDELIAVTHANEALPRFFIETLRNDIHPPLYFLQLDAWLALGANTDRWALANSLAWAAIALVTMFVVARRVHGERAAWFAVALFATLPSFVWSAGTLRMYATIPACVLVAYAANRRWFETRRSAWLVASIVAEIALAYLHAVEFFFVAFIVVGTLAEAAQRAAVAGAPRLSRRALGPWLAGQAVFALAALPLAASALVRGSDASAPGSLLSTLMVGGGLVAGWKTSGIPALKAAGAVIFGVLAAAGVAARDSRARTLAIPIGALVVATLVGIALKPIYKQPVFAANLLPFVVLGAAAGAARLRWAAAAVAAVIVVLALAAFPLAPLQRQGEAYGAAAQSLRARVEPGDVVVIPNVSVFWGIARYAVGPAWGRPLAIKPPPSAEWARLNERIAVLLGPDAPARLGLVPERDFVERDGVRYVLNADAVEATGAARHAWVVTRDRYEVDVRLDPGLAPSTVVAATEFGDGELLLRRFDRAATGPAAPGAR